MGLFVNNGNSAHPAVVRGILWGERWGKHESSEMRRHFLKIFISWPADAVLPADVGDKVYCPYFLPRSHTCHCGIVTPALRRYCWRACPVSRKMPHWCGCPCICWGHRARRWARTYVGYSSLDIFLFSASCLLICSFLCRNGGRISFTLCSEQSLLIENLLSTIAPSMNHRHFFKCLLFFMMCMHHLSVQM